MKAWSILSVCGFSHLYASHPQGFVCEFWPCVGSISSRRLWSLETLLKVLLWPWVDKTRENKQKRSTQTSLNPSANQFFTWVIHFEQAPGTAFWQAQINLPDKPRELFMLKDLWIGICVCVKVEWSWQYQYLRWVKNNLLLWQTGDSTCNWFQQSLILLCCLNNCVIF